MALIEVAADGTVKTPHNPTIPFIEGDGTGRDIWRASVRVFDAGGHSQLPLAALDSRLSGLTALAQVSGSSGSYPGV